MPTTSFAQSLHEKSGGAIPLETATPEEVRMYITELLIDDYFTPPDEAKRHASKWEIGRCSQLFLNDEKAQRRIFGENVGLCIHRSLQQRMRALWEREPSVRYGNCMYSSFYFHALSLSLVCALANDFRRFFGLCRPLSLCDYLSNLHLGSHQGRRYDIQVSLNSIESHMLT